MNKIPRRIVTGIKDGKSVIMEDRHADNVVEHLPGLIISDIWNTQKMPTSLDFETKIPIPVFPGLPKTEPISGMWLFRRTRISAWNLKQGNLIR